MTRIKCMICGKDKGLNAYDYRKLWGPHGETVCIKCNKVRQRDRKQKRVEYERARWLAKKAKKAVELEQRARTAVCSVCGAESELKYRSHHSRDKDIRAIGWEVAASGAIRCPACRHTDPLASSRKGRCIPQLPSRTYREPSGPNYTWDPLLLAQEMAESYELRKHEHDEYTCGRYLKCLDSAERLGRECVPCEGCAHWEAPATVSATLIGSSLRVALDWAWGGDEEEVAA